MGTSYSRRGLFLRVAREILSRSAHYTTHHLPWLVPPPGEGRGSPTPFRPEARTWREKLIDVARLLGVQEAREPEEIYRGIALHLGQGEPGGSGEELLAAIARGLGLDPAGAAPLALLERMGERLGVPRPFVHDWNRYLAGAERYWAKALAAKLGVPTVRTDDEILRRMAAALGIGGPGATGGEATLRAIAEELGVAPASDPLGTLDRIESRLRLAGR